MRRIGWLLLLLVACGTLAFVEYQMGTVATIIVGVLLIIGLLLAAFIYITDDNHIEGDD